MGWYFFICLLMLYPLALQIKAERSGFRAKGLIIITSCLILFFFFALRGEKVGVDTKNYCYAFRQFADIPLKDVFSAPLYGSSAHTWKFNFEPGFRLLNKLVSYLSSDGQAITIAVAALIYPLLGVFIYRASPDAWLSIWLFLTLGIFQTEMNISRNAISIFMCCLALPLIEKRKLFSYVLIVLLACTIHQTAFLFLLLYPLIRFVPLNRRRAAVIFLVALFIGLNFSLFREPLHEIFPGRYAKYLNSDNDKLISLAVGIFNVFVVLLSALLLRRDEREGLLESDRVGSWIILLYVSLFALSIGYSVGARAAALFGPYLIVLIPQILDRIEDPRRKRAAVVLIAVLCFAQYAARLQVNNIGGSMPYYFFWQS